MRRLSGLLILVLGSQLSFAQLPNPSEAVMDMAAERTRIQTERERAESRFREQELACYARFSVTDCLQDVRLNRRLLLDDLRRQTVVLNDMERRKKSISKIDLIQRKSEAQKKD